jgi:hypothetical protein
LFFERTVNDTLNIHEIRKEEKKGERKKERKKKKEEKPLTGYR